RMTQNKQVIVGVMPNPGEISPDFRTSDSFFIFLLLVKESITTFYQTDLSGTWRVYGLGTPRFPAVTPLGAIGTLSMDGSGALGTFVQVDGTVETLGGRLTLAADGLISGTISSADDTTVLQATLSSDKKFMVGVGTTSSPNGDVSRDLFIFLRDEAFALSDLAGTWQEQDLSLSYTQGNLGESVLGSIVFNGAGTVTTGGLYSELAGPSGLQISAGTLSINPSGFLVGPFSATTGPSAMIATVVPSTEMMVGLIAKEVNVQTSTPQELAFAVLVRDPGMDPKVLAEGSLRPII